MDAPAAAPPTLPAPAPPAIRDPRALSTEYHKARKQLMLWAAVLFIWELVGIDLEKAKEVGGNAGAIIIAIKSPQAVPWVLLVLVAYFLFKVTIEWYQCNLSRRERLVSRIDFFSAWIVSLMAYVLYLMQAIRRVQFANLQGKARITSFLLVGVFSFLAAILTKIVQGIMTGSIDLSRLVRKRQG